MQPQNETINRKRVVIFFASLGVLLVLILLFFVLRKPSDDGFKQALPDTESLSPSVITKNINEPHPGPKRSIYYYSGSCFAVLRVDSASTSECQTPVLTDYSFDNITYGPSSALATMQATGDEQVEALMYLDFQNKKVSNVDTSGLISIIGTASTEKPGEHLFLAGTEHGSYDEEGPVLVNQAGERIYSFEKYYGNLIDAYSSRVVMESPRKEGEALTYVVFNTSTNEEELKDISSQTKPVLYKDKVFYTETLGRVKQRDEGHGGDNMGRLVVFDFTTRKTEILIDEIRLPSVQIDKINSELIITGAPEDDDPKNPQYSSIVYNLEDNLSKRVLRYRPGLSTTHRLLFLGETPVASLSTGDLFELKANNASSKIAPLSSVVVEPAQGSINEDIQFSYDASSQTLIVTHPYMLWPSTDSDPILESFFSTKNINASQIKTVIRSERF